MERLDLLKNVHVFIRDVGKSGMMPGAAPAKKPATGERPGQGRHRERTGRKDGSGRRAGRANAAGPALRLEDAGLPAQIAAAGAGRSARAAGSRRWSSSTAMSWSCAASPDDRPDQLTCDTLKLSLVPG